jgi:hypothetical protein
MSTLARTVVLGLVFAACITAVGCAGRQPKPSLVPPQNVDMDAEVLSEFYDEVQEYVRLRQEASTMVPPIAVGNSAEQIGAHQQAIADVIRVLRGDAKRGDIFEPEVAAAFRRIIEREVHGPEGPEIVKEIADGNPKVEGVPKQSNPTQEVKKPVEVKVNGYYADGAPFSSVPPSLLLKMPQLPEQVRYRFVGRTLILRDTEANVILDFIPDIVPDKTIPR